MVISTYNYMNQILDENLDFFNHGYLPSYEGYDNDIMKNRMSLYRYMLKDIKTKGKKVLDVGCGRGGFSRVYKEFGFSEISGCDITPSNIDFAIKHYDGVDFKVCDAHNLSDVYPTNHFDIITSLESAHHYQDRDRFFSEVSKLLNKDGIFIYADVNAQIGGHFQYIEQEDITKNVLASVYQIMIECERMGLDEKIVNLTKHAFSLYTGSGNKYIKYVCY